MRLNLGALLYHGHARLEKSTGMIRLLEVMLKHEEDLRGFRHGCSGTKAKDKQLLNMAFTVIGSGLRNVQGCWKNART